MRIKILLYFGMFLIVLGILNSQPCGTSSAPCNGDWKNFDYANPSADISQIPSYEVDIDKVMAYNRGKELTTAQIQDNFDKIPNLNTVDFGKASKAIFNKYGLTLNWISEGASLLKGILKATFGSQDQLDLSNKERWIIEIDNNGRIIILNDIINENQIANGDSFTIPNEAKLITKDGKTINLKGLSYSDGKYYVKKGMTAIVNNIQIKAQDNDVNVILNSRDYLKLLTVQTELNNELRENGWTKRAEDLVKERKNVKDKLGVMDSIASKQILKNIEDSSISSVVFDSNALLINGAGFDVRDGSKIITPRGGNILRIERENKLPLYKTWGKVTMEEGNFEIKVEEKENQKMKVLLGTSKFTELKSSELNDKESTTEPKKTLIEATLQDAATNREEKILKKGESPSMLIGYKNAIDSSTIYTVPLGYTFSDGSASKYGNEMTDGDFRRLPPGTIISHIPDEKSITITMQTEEDKQSLRVAENIRSDNKIDAVVSPQIYNSLEIKKTIEQYIGKALPDSFYEGGDIKNKEYSPPPSNKEIENYYDVEVTWYYTPVFFENEGFKSFKDGKVILSQNKALFEKEVRNQGSGLFVTKTGDVYLYRYDSSKWKVDIQDDNRVILTNTKTRETITGGPELMRGLNAMGTSIEIGQIAVPQDSPFRLKEKTAEKVYLNFNEGNKLNGYYKVADYYSTSTSWKETQKIDVYTGFLSDKPLTPPEKVRIYKLKPLTKVAAIK